MTISEMRKSLDIFAKYIGEDKYWDGGADHDTIYSILTTRHIPEDSEDGKVLTELGWYVDGKYWSLMV